MSVVKEGLEGLDWAVAELVRGIREKEEERVTKKVRAEVMKEMRVQAKKEVERGLLQEADRARGLSDVNARLRRRVEELETWIGKKERSLKEFKEVERVLRSAVPSARTVAGAAREIVEREKAAREEKERMRRVEREKASRSWWR